MIRRRGSRISFYAEEMDKEFSNLRDLLTCFLEENYGASILNPARRITSP
jgi:hypothetical protein